MNTESKPSRGYPVAGDRRIWPEGREPGDVLGRYPILYFQVEGFVVDPTAQKDPRWQQLVMPWNRQIKG
jgi:hypothetical protein